MEGDTHGSVVITMIRPQDRDQILRRKTGELEQGSELNIKRS